MWSREDERREALDAVLDELRHPDLARDRAAACAYLLRHLAKPSQCSVVTSRSTKRPPMAPGQMTTEN